MRKLVSASALLAASLLAPAAPQEEVARVGQVPEFSFAEPIVDGPGLASLADFRGRPLLVEFWGTY